MAPQALGYRIAGLSEHEHDGRGATVSHHKGCPDSTSAMMFSFIYMMYIVYTPRFTLPSFVCQMSLHCFHFHHSPSTQLF